MQQRSAKVNLTSIYSLRQTVESKSWYKKDANVINPGSKDGYNCRTIKLKDFEDVDSWLKRIDEAFEKAKDLLPESC
jgi:hypothetical protein